MRVRVPARAARCRAAAGPRPWLRLRRRFGEARPCAFRHRQLAQCRQGKHYYFFFVVITKLVSTEKVEGYQLMTAS